jgi:predicted permease
MVRSIQNIQTTDYGFDTSSVLTARMGLFEGEYPKSEDRHAFWTRLTRTLESRPDIASVALYNRYRWNTMGGWARLAREGRAYPTFDDHPLSNYEQVTPGYFSTLGVRIVAGRDFNEADAGGGPYIIVNQKLAAEFFPNEDPIGQRLMRQTWPNELGPDGKPPVHPWMTVIGVVPSMQSEGAGQTIEQVSGRAFYTLLEPKDAPMFMTVAVRARGGPPKALLPGVRDEVTKLDPNLPLYAIGTPAELIAEDTSQMRIITNIFKIFGVVAVFLAAVGIYGVVSFSVNQRRQEFGIRGALGATSRGLLVMVLRANLIHLGVGLLLGVPAAWGLSQLMRAVLFGVSPRDPGTYVIVVVMLTLVAFAACLVPAMRAARIHPAQALRHS